MSTTRLPAVAG